MVTKAKKLRKSGLAETRKEKLARLKRIEQTHSDPRERLWALRQIDEMAMDSVAIAGKAAPALLTKRARQQLADRLERQASYTSDPVARLRMQDQLRELGREA